MYDMYPAIVARSIFTAFGDMSTRRRGLVVRAEQWLVEVLVEDVEVQRKYARALTAATRVVTYWHDEWEPATTAATPTQGFERARETAVELCAEPHAGIMIAGMGLPGGEATDSTGLKVVGAAESDRVHTTHEASVVSAWLRGECDSCDSEAAEAEARMRDLFQSTIALSWPLDKTTDNMDNYYGNAIVVRDAKLDSGSTKKLTATLVFVVVPEKGARRANSHAYEERLGLSVRGGLDAMIVEGVRTAIIAPACTDEAYIRAFEEILNTALNEPPLQPLEYVGDSAVTAVTHLSRRACFSRVVIPAPLTTARPAFGRFV
jgi:hypothetical protein